MTIGHIRQDLHPITKVHHLPISSRRTIRRIIYVQPIITTSFLYYQTTYLSTSSGIWTSGSTSSGNRTSGSTSSGIWTPPHQVTQNHRLPVLPPGYQSTDTGHWKLPPNDKCGIQEILVFGPGQTKCFKTEYPVLAKNRKTGKQGDFLFLLNFKKNHIFHHFFKNTKFHTFVKNTIFEKIPIFVRATKIVIFTLFAKIPKNNIFYKNTKNHKIPKIAIFTI